MPHGHTEMNNHYIHRNIKGTWEFTKELMCKEVCSLCDNSPPDHIKSPRKQHCFSESLRLSATCHEGWHKQMSTDP